MLQKSWGFCKLVLDGHLLTMKDIKYEIHYRNYQYVVIRVLEIRE